MAFSMTPAGVRNALNITAPAVVKAAPGYTVTVVVSGNGSGSPFTMNDCTTVAAAAASNQVVSIPQTYFSGSSAGILPLIFVFNTGITISSVPTGVTVAVSYA